MKKRSQDTYDASKLSSSFSCKKSVVSVFLSPGRKSYVILLLPTQNNNEDRSDFR